MRVLFLCTHNSARSQIAEAILRRHGGGRLEVASAGTEPAERVHPMAVEVLGLLGADVSRHCPKSWEAVWEQPWDIVVTVCDSARESCPHIPGRPAIAHWGMPDPAAVTGSEEEKRRAFRDTAAVLARRIDLLLALPVEKLEQIALEQRIRAIPETDGASERMT